MALPWLQIIDAVLGVANFARGRAPKVDAAQGRSDHDRGSLGLERERLALEQERAERARRIELLGQAGDREIGRLRFIAGVAVVVWIGTVLLLALFPGRTLGGSIGVRVTIGAGWLLLLGALACALAGQSRISTALARIDGAAPALVSGAELSSGAAGLIAPWLIVSGVALVGLAVLAA